MKRLIISLLLLTLYIAPMARAEVGVGYELLGIFPHALTLTTYDQGSGFGLKASADFGTSTFSTITSAFASAFSFGNLSNVSFVTVSLLKDFYQYEDSHHAYVKLGAMALSAQGTGGQSATGYLAIIGLGGEWKGVFGNKNLASSIELTYPELLLIGLKCYF